MQLSCTTTFDLAITVARFIFTLHFSFHKWKTFCGKNIYLFVSLYPVLEIRQPCRIWVKVWQKFCLAESSSLLIRCGGSNINEPYLLQYAPLLFFPALVIKGMTYELNHQKVDLDRISEHIELVENLRPSQPLLRARQCGAVKNDASYCRINSEHI